MESITTHNDTAVLLVEDNEDDALLVKRSLRKAGVTCRMEILSDGDAAIRYLSGEGGYGDRSLFPIPRLVLLDLKLPRKNGFEVLSWLRGQPGLRRIPVVVLTSSREDIDLKRAYDLGANSYLVKRTGADASTTLLHTLSLYWLVCNETASFQS